MVSKWHKLKYDSQPYLCTLLGRFIAMILNRHDLRTLDVANKIDAVCARFLKLHKFCGRHHGCASEWLLPGDDPLVLQDLRGRQLRGANLIWLHRWCKEKVKINRYLASLKPTRQLEASSRRYKAAALIKAIALHPDPRIFFRDSQSQFGKGRASNFANRVMARAWPKVFTFDKTKPKRASRIVLGWESMRLGGHPDQALQNIAGNKCPVPVRNAIYLSTLESVGSRCR